MLPVACNVSGRLIRVKTCCHFCPLLVPPRALLPAPASHTGGPVEADIGIIIVTCSLCTMCGSRHFHTPRRPHKGIAKYLLVKCNWQNNINPLAKALCAFPSPALGPLASLPPTAALRSTLKSSIFESFGTNSGSEVSTKGRFS